MDRLEDRLLFSTAPVPIDALLEPDVGDPAIAPAWSPDDFFESTTQDDFAAFINRDDVRSRDGDSSRQVALIDARIEGISQLVTDLQRDNLEGRVDVVVYQGGDDVLQQLTDFISEYRGLDAIHWIPHGDAGAVELGSQFLTASNADRYADLFTSWQNSLNDDADLLVYSCNVAAFEDGRAPDVALAATRAPTSRPATTSRATVVEVATGTSNMPPA